MIPRFFCFSLILLIFLALSSYAETEEEVKLRQVTKQLKESKTKLIETKKKEQEALTQLVFTKTKLHQAEENLHRANKKILVNQQQIGKLSSDLKITYENLQVKSAKLKNRLVEVYKSSSVNYLELLLSSGNMSDFINKFYFFSKIIEKDSTLIFGISHDYNKIQTQKESLVKTTGQIKELAAEIEDKKNEIADRAKEVKTIYSSLKERRQDYEKQVSELERSSQQLEKAIVAKMAERKRQHITVSGSTGSLDWPLRGRITSTFGYRRHPIWGGSHKHTGLDVAAPYGEVIRAADGGEVIFAGWWDGYGKAIVIDHGKNISTVYGHMSRLYMQPGNQVKKGQIIGLVGSTGYSTGPHLHFEVRINGKPHDPKGYLP